MAENSLNARNPMFNRNGTIDLELDHPKFGWIPFTAAPDDEQEHGRLLYHMALAGEFGPVVPFEDDTPPTGK